MAGALVAQVEIVVAAVEAERQFVRERVGQNRFIEVFVDTPLAICEQPLELMAKRDIKRLCAATGHDDETVRAALALVGRQQEQGGIVKAEGAIYACKVMPVCPKCGKATRVGHSVKDGKTVRVCRKCGAEL